MKLEARLEKLKSVRFHEKLGTQGQRVERIAELAKEIAPHVGADPALAEEAARLAKADLATEMVGEFPELQGLMGRYYATLEGHKPEVAAAIDEHYKPVGPSDSVPTKPVSIAVALADKLDTLVGFWAIKETPTGSKDPYALRRAALGVISILLDNHVSMDLVPLLVRHGDRFPNHDSVQTAFDLVSFVSDRLKVRLKEQGSRHDLVDAVLQLGLQRPNQVPGMRNVRDLLSIVNRVNALSGLLASEDGANLLAGYKRAANFLRDEEKKDGEGAFEAKPDAAMLAEPEEKALAHVLDSVEKHVADHLARDDYEGAMRQMAELRPAVDAFFEKILVNAQDAALRLNRLRLLAQLRRVTAQVADFGRIAG